ncbi:hypothetical protein SK128_027098 [Halocaridina rubra]|uniref:Uncharacterized protein n=1 Tax=Halocaridina rubra TaxID=373956 RepID=A0AAN8ZX16_HALRR
MACSLFSFAVVACAAVVISAEPAGYGYGPPPCYPKTEYVTKYQTKIEKRIRKRALLGDED